MKIAPKVKLTLGNLIYDTHASSVMCSLGLLPGVNSLRVSLPANVNFDAALNDEGSLTVDMGDGAKTVLKGKIRHIQKSVFSTKFVVADSGADLSQFRPASTFEKQNAKDIIHKLAGDINVATDTIDLDLPLAGYVAHQQQTAAEHIRNLSRLAGAFARVSEDDKLVVKKWPGKSADIVLTFGRDFHEYATQDIEGLMGRPFTIGNGPAGSADAPDALRETTEYLPSDAAAPGKNARWLPQAVLRTPDAATKASESLAVEQALFKKQFRAKCVLNAELAPGRVLEVNDVPNGLNGGPWILQNVTHHIQAHHGGLTWIDGVLAEEPGALLDSIGSAIGGLL